MPGCSTRMTMTIPAEKLYLDLLKGVLTRLILPDTHFDRSRRELGLDWPSDGETMIGMKRLDNLDACIQSVVHDGVPGDLIETGVWRGGACIFMRAALEAYGDAERRVWVADSFQGLPQPDPSRVTDVADALWRSPELAISLEQVRSNFDRYGMVDERVRFLPGWFADTLPNAPVEKLDILRLDGDMYDSTMVALESLYPKLSIGGYVILDDYLVVRGCKAATDDFRARYEISDEMRDIDGSGTFWRRTR